MDRPTLRDWVIRFNEQGPDGLVNRSSPGAPRKLTDKHKAFLGRLAEEGPIPAATASCAGGLAISSCGSTRSLASRSRTIRSTVP